MSQSSYNFRIITTVEFNKLMIIYVHNYIFIINTSKC